MAVVNRGEKYDEKEVSNKWRWEWCTKLENEERVGDYIRKIDTPGHAKCIFISCRYQLRQPGFALLGQPFEAEKTHKYIFTVFYVSLNSCILKKKKQKKNK